MNQLGRWTELLFPAGIIACLFVIFVPLPPAIMDILLAANISVAVILLLTTIFVKTPLELSVFPSLLLGTTLARLALNIGTTRLILTRGAIDGDMAAGGVIQTFGEFVGGNNIAIGLVIFAIIIVIQFVVITKGATRISEVAARFALDGMPGRQMAIDADLNSGVIDTETAQLRRQEVADNADFYGAMDGASKFVRGDAIAGVLITAINIAGGLIIGLTNHMSVSQAAEVFTRLTIGDGLASQLPALLIALAAGLLVTRSARHVDLPRESIKQVFGNPLVLVITAVFLGAMIFTQMPKTPLLLIAAACLGISYVLTRQSANSGKVAANKMSPAEPKPIAKPTEVTIDKLLSNDVLEMELGINLIPLADPKAGGTLLAAITQVRKQLAAELGIILPKIRVRDNLELAPQHFRILVQGHPADTGVIEPECFLAVDTGLAQSRINPESIRGIFNENLHSEPAYWIEPAAEPTVRQSGYVVMSATDVLADQLKELSRSYAAQLLTRDAARQLIDETRKQSPAVVDELIPSVMSLAQVQRILKNLVAEGVSIRPLGLILETLGDHAASTDNHWELTEQVRQKLGKHIIHGLSASSGGPIHVFTISEELQNRIESAWEKERNDIKLNLPRDIVTGIANAILEASGKMTAAGQRPIALVQQSIRPVIAELAYEIAPDLTVVGDREAIEANIEVIGEVNAENLRMTDSSAA